MSDKLLCSYCKKEAKLVTGKEIFPNNISTHDKYYWYCKDCSAWIGCYPKTNFYSQDGTTPMGTLANVQLRSIRAELHNVFDLIWKQDHMRRGHAYMWLAKKMKMTVDDCHIANFDYAQCCEAYTYVHKYLKARTF